MAKREHLSLIKQGITVWNKWREDNPREKPDLSGADLVGAKLNEVNLSKANLQRADFNMADLRAAYLRDADLFMTNLMTADLTEADLTEASLMQADLYGADLSKANLSGADLSSAVLWKTNLREANLSETEVGESIFADMDLSVVKLDNVKHTQPSTIGIDTVYRSKGKIPEVFLRGAGIQDTFIDHIVAIANQPDQFYSCFISYSGKDESFAERLYSDLQSEGIRCWFAPEDIKIGDRIRQAIDQSIRLHDKLLLVLSKHSIGSEWVEKEVETAFEEERKRKKIVLFPIRLDSTVMDTDQTWAADIRRTRHIGEFTQWKNHEAYQKALNRLLRDLKDNDMHK